MASFKKDIENTKELSQESFWERKTINCLRKDIVNYNFINGFVQGTDLFENGGYEQWILSIGKRESKKAAVMEQGYFQDQGSKQE